MAGYLVKIYFDGVAVAVFNILCYKNKLHIFQCRG
jgi:hypothetical protein